MSERPIIFNDAMARAVRDGMKTVTRRPVLHTGAPVHHDRRGSAWRRVRNGWAWCEGYDVRGVVTRCPHGSPGDVLWVRECWACPESITFYRADEDSAYLMPPGEKWRPSIHMPRWAARTFLRVTDVRAGRLLVPTR